MHDALELLIQSTLVAVAVAASSLLYLFLPLCHLKRDLRLGPQMILIQGTNLLRCTDFDQQARLRQCY